MMEMPVKKRVSRLENLMAQLIRTVDRVDQQVERTERDGQRMQRSVERLSEEMRDFKREMRDFKEEMRDFKDEILDFKTEGRKQWGELANKMGTMAEDLVAPSIERILREVVGCERNDVEYVAVRVRRRHRATNQRREFDVVAVCGEYLLVNETKSSLRPEALDTFAKEVLPRVRDYFPEFDEKKVIGAVASLYVNDSVVRCGERLGLIVLGFGEDVMDVLNDPDFVPTEY